MNRKQGLGQEIRTPAMDKKNPETWTKNKDTDSKRTWRRRKEMDKKQRPDQETRTLTE